MSSSEGTSLYAPAYATFGDYPLKKDDIPGSIFFIVIFALLGVVNMVIYWSNIARGHKFNIKFSQQVFTSRHPSRAYVGSAYYRLMRLYQTSITEYYHVSASTQKSFVTFRKVAMIYFVLVAFTPLLTLTAAYAISQSHEDKTYSGTYRPDSLRESEVAQKPVHVIPPPERVLIVLTTLILTFTTAVLATLNEKPWYDYRATMYMCVGFAEALIVIVWTIGRVDLMFYFPVQKWDGLYGLWRTN
ncbi:hypothetical protein V1524DRAFT_445046 [Lipomyces starkeyi]